MALAVPTVQSTVASVDRAIRVMVVDDAVVVRGLVSRWVEEEPGLVLAASLRNGREAVDQLDRVDPDVVILDIEMPELDGISALPLLLAKKRDLVVIMASTLTRQNAQVSLRALAPAAPAVPLKLRAFASTLPRVLLIGSSTGGPQALSVVVTSLRALLPRVPVLITQHIPPTFTTILAEHLARAAGGPAHEGIQGEPVLPGTIYVAPGGRHMQVTKRDSGIFIALDDGPLVNYCRPAVDPLFYSAAAAWGPAALALILTGMGSDGSKGGAGIISHGGTVIAQDEASSVVWGMPGTAAHAGICSAVLPLDQIAPRIMRVF